MPHPSFDHTYQAIVHSAVGATAAGATVDIRGLSSLGIYVSGLTTGTLAPQVSNDSATWSSIPVTNVASNASGTIVTASGNYRADISGFQYLKMPITDFTTGTITVGINGQPNAGGASSGGGISSGTINAATINIGTMVGNVASGVADSGNPVKVGLVYQGTAPVGTSGQRGDMQGDSGFNLKTTLATKIAGEDLTADVLKTEQRFSYAQGTAAATVVVKGSAGFVHALNILGGVFGAVTVYDNASGTAALASQIVPTFTPAGTNFPMPPIIVNSSAANGIVIGCATTTIWQMSYR